MGVPIGMPFIGHYPPGMLPPNVVPVFVSQPMYGAVPQIPVQMVTTSVNTFTENNQTGFSMAQETAEIEHNEQMGNSSSSSSIEKDAKSSAEAKPAQKTYERRNKKKRPPDYYEKLAASQGKGDGFTGTENSSSTTVTTTTSTATSSQNVVTFSVQNITDVTSNNTEVCERTRENKEITCSEQDTSSTTATQDATIIITATENDVQEESYAHLQSNENISHIASDSPSLKKNNEDEDPQKAASISTESSEVPCDNSDTVVVNDIKTLANMAQDKIESDNAESVTQNVVVQSTVTVDDTALPEDQQVKVSETPLESENIQPQNADTISEVVDEVAKDSQVEKQQTVDIKDNVPLKEEIGDAAKEHSVTTTDVVIKEELKDNVVVEKPKKASWAGLFSDTKQAKNATVIYVGM